MIYAEILAGGKGTRMGNTEMPKQFLMLGNKPIIIHTIEQFLINPKIDKVIVCCPEAWISYMNDLLEKYLKDDGRIFVAKGGSTRNETIINGCYFIRDNFGLDKKDIIITHDAVRPFINQRIINDNIDAMKKNDAADTVIPATDTIVESKDGKVISNIPIRSEYYQGQTPQTFKLESLIDIYETLTDSEKEVLTDACKMFVIKGKKVTLVAGELYNIKITASYDLKIANAILEGSLND